MKLKNQLIGAKQKLDVWFRNDVWIMMSEFDCQEAINLDGGGSSAMVAESRLLNRPVGRTSQREVMSAIGIFYKWKLWLKSLIILGF